jgi:hypothetical protein
MCVFRYGLHLSSVANLGSVSDNLTQPDRFASGKVAADTHWTGWWVEARVDVDAVAREKISLPCRESSYSA